MGECPNVAWVGRKEKEKYGVRPMINPPTEPNPPKSTPLYGDILTQVVHRVRATNCIRALAKRFKGKIVPSYTMTREKRPREKEGIDGVFITKDKFEKMIENGEFTAGEVDLWVKQKNGEYYVAELQTLKFLSQ